MALIVTMASGLQNGARLASALGEIAVILSGMNCFAIPPLPDGIARTLRQADDHAYGLNHALSHYHTPLRGA